MGNSVPRIPLEEIQLTPGNVLIQVNDDDARKAQSMSKGDGTTHYHNLIRGRVIRVCAVASPPGYPERSVAYLKRGDEVWVRARKGFPVDIGNGRRMFVVNEWDVAIKVDKSSQPTSSRSTSDIHVASFYHSDAPDGASSSPPPYQEKPPLI